MLRRCYGAYAGVRQLLWSLRRCYAGVTEVLQSLHRCYAGVTQVTQVLRSLFFHYEGTLQRSVTTRNFDVQNYEDAA